MVSPAARAASDPYLASRLLDGWRTTCGPVSHEDAGTLHCSAAAATNNARAVAPICRKLSQSERIASLPPTPWPPYFPSVIEYSTRTLFQSASSSSATSIGSDVVVPSPISGCAHQINTLSSG